MARPRTIKPMDLYPNWPSAEGYAGPSGDHTATLRIVVSRLAKHITEHGWSRRQTAEVVGVNHVSLHDMLVGNTWPRAEHIAQIELALDVVLWPRLYEVRDGDG